MGKKVKPRKAWALVSPAGHMRALETAQAWFLWDDCRWQKPEAIRRGWRIVRVTVTPVAGKVRKRK